MRIRNGAVDGRLRAWAEKDGTISVKLEFSPESSINPSNGPNPKGGGEPSSRSALERELQRAERRVAFLRTRLSGKGKGIGGSRFARTVN